MNYIKISKFDTANGNGVGCVLWLSGCEHHCPQCHNPQTWDLNYGQEFDESAKEELFKSLDRGFIKRLTFSGGDPLHTANRECVGELITEIKSRFPNLKIWLYTGYTLEDINSLSFLKDIDVLVDGRFKIELKDVSLKYCGSSNQRVIDVQKSLSEDKVVLWGDES